MWPLSLNQQLAVILDVEDGTLYFTSFVDSSWIAQKGIYMSPFSPNRIRRLGIRFGSIFSSIFLGSSEFLEWSLLPAPLILRRGAGRARRVGRISWNDLGCFHHPLSGFAGAASLVGCFFKHLLESFHQFIGWFRDALGVPGFLIFRAVSVVTICLVFLVPC